MIQPLKMLLSGPKKKQKSKYKQERKAVHITFQAGRWLDYGTQKFFRSGYLFLQSVYFDQQINKICEKMKEKYNFQYDNNATLSDLIDFRRQTNSLTAIVSMQFHLNPFADQCM